MKHKRQMGVYALLLACVLLLCLWIWKFPVKQQKRVYKIGVCVYDLDDSFMKSMTEELEQALETQVSANLPVRYEVLDANGNDNVQQKQIQYLLKQDCDVLVLNLVKADSAADSLNQARSRDIPVILFNREPDKMDLQIGDKIWYVGTDGQAAGALQATMLREAWDSQHIDKNQNGTLDYILIEGEQSHYDTIRRTNAFLSETGKNLPMNQLAGLSADWARERAAEQLGTLSEQELREAEAIVCNNDDMALGAYDFYQRKGWDSPLILGINKTQAMQQRIDDGEIYGTVDINPSQQVHLICQLINQMAAGTSVQQKIWYAEPLAYKTADK